MTLASTTPKEIKNGNDVTTVFSFTFVINQSSDLEVTHTDSDGVETVLTEGSGTTNYSVSVSSYPGNGSITYPATLGTELATGEKLTIARVVDVDQDTDLQNQGAYLPSQVEDAFDYSRMIDLQQQEQIDRAIKVAISDDSGADFTLPTPVADKVIAIWNAAGDAMVIGPTADEITNAQTYANNAATSATNAATSETNAATSETNAAASATAAAASVSSIAWNDVLFKTNADSPITLTDSDNGKLYVIDCSSGAVTVNLPTITDLTLSNPWAVGIKKSDTSGNAITINRGGTDTIDGATSKTISTADAGATLVPDTDPTPDEWTSVDFGASAGNMTVDNFADGVHYTSGTTTQLTLSVEPGTENNIDVLFDGLGQHHDTYSVSGTTLTFDAAIPTGTSNVEVKIGTTLSIGVPGDGTVTTAKLATDAVTAVKTDTSVNAIGDFGGGTQDIDLDSGRSVSATVSTSSVTFTFSNPKSTGNEDIFTLSLTNGGSQTVNWPASVDWAGGTAPGLTAAGVDELVFKTIDGGTIWVGSYLLDAQ